MATDLTPILNGAAQEWRLDPTLLASVSQVESGQQANGPDSSAGAIGPLQVMPGTASDMGATNPRDPVQNIYAGAKYLSGLIDKYHDPQLALAAYNAGPQRVDDYLAGKAPLPPETIAYVPKVARAYAAISGASGQGGTPKPAGSYDVAAADTGSMTDANPSPLAPPAGAASGTTSPATADPFGQLMQAAGAASGAGPAAPVAASASPSAPVPAPSAPAAGGDPFSDLMAAAGKAASSPMAPAGATALATGSATPGTSSALPAATGSGIMPAIGSALSNLGSGIQTGVAGIANTGMRAAAYVDRKVPALANLDAAAGLNPAAGTQQLSQQIQQANAAHAGSPLYTAGKIGSDLAFTLPVTAGLGGALAAGAEGVGLPTLGSALANAPAVVRLGGALAGNVAKGAAQGAVTGALTSGSSDRPALETIEDGAKWGGLLGGAIPAAVGAARGVASTALGGSISPETAALAQTARDTYGIPLQAGQISDSPFVRFLGDQLNKLPFSGSGPAAAGQTTAMNRAIASTFGSSSDTITPAVMSAARDRLGQTFDTLAGQIDVQADPQLLTDLGGIVSKAKDVLTSDQQGVVGRQLLGVLDKVQQGNGTLSGPVYQNLIAKGGALDDAMNSGNPGVRLYAGQIRDALDSAMQRSAPPDVAQQLAEARFQYKNLMTIAPLVKDAQDGDVSPLKLLRAVKSNFSDMAFSGAGPLGDLANIAQRFLKAPPDSGTATRNMILGGLGAMTPTGLAAVAHEPISALGGALGTAGTILGGRAVSSFLRSPYAANRLISNGLAGNPVGNAFTNNLLSNAAPASVVLGGALNPQSRLAYPGR